MSLLLNVFYVLFIIHLIIIIVNKKLKNSLVDNPVKMPYN